MQTDYDVLPYRSVPYAATQPAHVGAVARLFGLDPAAPRTARVLELGCASGGNLIPLAARYPQARFTGIDLSARHVAEAQATIAALGLTNIRIDQGDIAEARFDADAFDYIICHGVFSWVPPEAQDRILQIGAESLTPDGVIYVSYNIYPGWHLRTIVRDICLYHAGTQGGPAERVARARWALTQMAGNASDQSPYGQLLRTEAELCARQPDSYILGEFLAEHNAPCYFHDFAARAADAGLGYLSETELATSLPETMPGDTAGLIRRIAGDSGMAIEQYMDFFGGRQFRRSLLIRADQAHRTSRRLGADALASMHFASTLRAGRPDTPGGPVPFSDARQKMDVADPALQQLLAVLEDAAPGTLTPGAIHARMSESGALPADVGPDGLVQAMFPLVASGRLQIFLDGQHMGRAGDARPEIWPLARHQIGAGQGWIATQRHTVMAVPDGAGAIIGLIDGSRDRAGLEHALTGLIRTGAVALPEGTVPPDDAALRELARGLIDRALKSLEREGVLTRKGTV